MLRLQTPLTERYTAAAADDLAARIAAAKDALGDRLFILGHHYQRDEIIRWADARGDSYRLSVLAQQRPEAEYIVFCGVHFMAESADILTADHQKVILPDLNAGCSMADMADIDEVEEAWEALAGVIDIDRVVPDHLHEQLGRPQGVRRPPRRGRVHVDQRPRRPRVGARRRPGATGGIGDQVLFFPDQHLGRNTGVAMGYGLDDMRRVGPPPRPRRPGRARAARSPRSSCGGATARSTSGSGPSRSRPSGPSTPTASSSSTPRCRTRRCAVADQVGSTDYIIRVVAEAPAGSVVGVGTEVHLVNRLAQEHPDKTVVSLDPLICPCSTMNRIDEPHLAWVLDELVAGRVVNQITVDAGHGRPTPGSRSSACSTSPDRSDLAALTARLRRMRRRVASPGRDARAPGPAGWWGRGRGGSGSMGRSTGSSPTSRVSPWWQISSGAPARIR